MQIQKAQIKSKPAKKKIKKIVPIEKIGGAIQTDRGKVIFETLYRDQAKNPLVYAVWPLDSEDPKLTYESEIVDVKGFHYVPPLSSKQAFISGSLRTASDAEEFVSQEVLWNNTKNLVIDYCALSDDVSWLVTWAIFYYDIWDFFGTSLNLIIRGAHGKGKNRLQDMFKYLCIRTLNVCVVPTEAVLFRCSDAWSPLILFDEFTLNPKNPNFDSYIAIWNAGFHEDSSVIRMEKGRGGKYEQKSFDLHSPKIAIIKGSLPDQAFESRCLTITMPAGDKLAWDLYRKRRFEGVDILELGDDFKNRAQRIKNQLLMWRFKTWNRLKITGEFVIPNMASMRLFQVLNPMMTMINDKEENQRLFKIALKGEKMRRGTEVPEIDIALFKIMWRRLTSPINESLQVKTLTSELLENINSLGINDEYGISSHRVSYILKYHFYLDTLRKGGGVIVLCDLSQAIALAQDLGVYDEIKEDAEELKKQEGLKEKEKIEEKLDI